MKKKCSNCFQVKLWEEFYPRKKGTVPTCNSDTQGRCKQCNADVVWAYVQRKKFGKDVLLDIENRKCSLSIKEGTCLNNVSAR